MAKLNSHPVIHLSITLELTEEEARALEALASYGADTFLTHFKQTISANFARDHGSAVRSLFASARTILPEYFARLDAARREFSKS